MGNKDGLAGELRQPGADPAQAGGGWRKRWRCTRKKEAICLELGDKDGLQRSYGNQALILQDWGRLDEALALLKKQEAICLELGNKDSLQRSYGNQAMILDAGAAGGGPGAAQESRSHLPWS